MFPSALNSLVSIPSRVLSPRVAAATAAAAIAMIGSSTASAVEIINVRSGQYLGAPGSPGDPDDIVRFNPGSHPVAAPLLGSAFTPAFFAATAANAPATVIQPHPAWMGGVTAPLSDPKARWINFAIDSNRGGTGGSALYAVPFTVTTANITGASITVEGGVDDTLGDAFFGGSNFDGLYVNGNPNGLATLLPTDFNFGTATTHTLTIPVSSINTGLNYLYFYQRDAGGSPSGLIFSAEIQVLPEPASAATIGGVAATLLRRRRR